MTVATIPEVHYEFAFNADPNQSTLPPYFTDLSSRVQFGWNTTRGKQYESDVNETGVWNVELANPDGALDPGNAASPYAPNVVPYRQCRIRCVLGNNLLAPDQASGGEWSPLAAGPVPVWLGVSSASGYAVSAAVVGGAAFQGTQVFAVAVPAAGASTKGLFQVAVPTVAAGQAYTFSAQVQVTTSGQNPQIYVSITWINAAGGVVSAVSSSAVVVTGAAGTWTALNVPGTAPVGAVAALVSVNTTSAFGVATTVWVDGLQLEARGYATRWQMPWQTGVNLLPRNIATGLETMNPVSDSPLKWFTPAGTLAGGQQVQQITNLTAAPNGSTTAVMWPLPAGATAGQALYVGAGATTGPVADCVQVTAGQSYTPSVYLTRSGPDATVTVGVSITWFTASGASVGLTTGGAATVPTASWVRGSLTATAPAGAVWARPAIYIATPSTFTGIELIYSTGWQFEQAASASTWADPGVTALLFSGMVERWPRTFNEADGTYGTSQLECVDAFAGLAQFTLQAPFVEEVLTYNPNFFYQLNDPIGSTACADTAGVRPPAPIENGPFGAGSLSLGSAVTATAVPSGAFLGSPGGVATFTNISNGSSPFQFPETFVSLHKTAAVPGPPVTGAFTRIITFRCSSIPPAGTSDNYTLWFASPGSWSGGALLRVQIVFTSGALSVTYNSAVSGGITWNSGSNVCDGNWHMLAIGVNPPGGGTASIWLDGVFQTSAVSVGIAGGYTSDVLGAQVLFGSQQFRKGLVGDLAHAIELPVMLTDNQAASLYASWRTASSGEPTGARYSRVLRWIGWSGPSSVDVGQTSAMGPATDLTGNSALDALNLIALAENGDQYASAAGVMTFRARSAFYNTRAPAVTFGEGLPVGSAGEWPVEVGSFDFDPSHLANGVQVQNYGGSLYQAGNPASRQRYFPRTYSRQINTASASEPQDAANYLLGQLKDPHQRGDLITAHPSAVLGLFPVVAQIDKGVRARLVKRPVGAPSTSLDVFTQKVDWTWTADNDVFVAYQASPADLTNYGVLAALHTSLNVQATAGASTATINALPDAAYNKLAQSLPSGYQLTFEPGTARAETKTIAPGGIPSTSLGYTTATITFTSTLAFTHAAGTPVCEPLPAGYVDPTVWDASAVIGATSTTVLSGGGAATATVTVGPLPDAAYNALGSTWNTNDTVTLSPNTVNAETMTILSVATTYPGYTSCVITFTANLAHSHAAGDTVCDVLPAGVATPAALSPTLRLAY